MGLLEDKGATYRCGFLGIHMSDDVPTGAFAVLCMTANPTIKIELNMSIQNNNFAGCVYSKLTKERLNKTLTV